MKYMFFECFSLEELDISNFNTSHVTDMSYMFSKCLKLKKLNISYFITDSLLYKDYMLAQCPEEIIKKIKSKITT